jgi:hypothetical protein
MDRDERPESLFRLGKYVAENGLAGPGEHRAARDLLMSTAPRLNGQSLQVEGEDTLSTATRVALALDQSVYPAQGPPGAGKTFAGARMICALVRAGNGRLDDRPKLFGWIYSVEKFEHSVENETQFVAIPTRFRPNL